MSDRLVHKRLPAILVALVAIACEPTSPASLIPGARLPDEGGVDAARPRLVIHDTVPTAGGLPASVPVHAPGGWRDATTDAPPPQDAGRDAFADAAPVLDAAHAAHGVVINEGPTPEFPLAWSPSQQERALGLLHAGWFYDYMPDTATPIPPGVTYIPMIYSRAHLGGLAAAAKYGILFGYNEPNLATQSNLTVAEVLEDWPKFEATGAYLISPSCACDESADSGWFYEFMTGAGGTYKPHIDAISIHSYQNPNGDPVVSAKAVLSYADKVSAKWGGKPVYVSETGGIAFNGSVWSNWSFASDSWTTTFQTTFITNVRSHPRVKGYAFYPTVYSSDVLTKAPKSATTMQMNPDLTMRPAGVAFSETF